MVSVVTGSVLLLLGAVLGVLSVKLALLGGSLFYLVISAGLLATGYLLVLRRRLARWVYAGLLLLVLIWAVWEVGFDWWPLVPRGALLTLIGLWLLAPGFGPAADPTDVNVATVANGWRSGRGALAAVLVLVAATAAISLLHDGFRIKGELPTQSVAIASAEPLAGVDWPAYGGDRYGRRYSTLADVNVDTVKNLKVAWTYHTGDKKLPSDPRETTFELTPLKIGDTLFLCTPHNHVVALDATTGKPKWTFDPRISIDQTSEHLTCRGVAYHADAAAAGQAAPAGSCARRIIAPTMDARLFALDAATGKPCPDFGEGGMVSLLTAMPNPKPRLLHGHLAAGDRA